MKQNRSVTPAASSAVQNMLADALRHHQGGRLIEAERLYREILVTDPDHADSLHLLGMIAYQRGSHDIAADLIERAIKRNAQVSYYHCNLGLVLSAQGKPGAAIARYRQALALQPDYVEAFNNLGNALTDQGDLEEAVTCFRRAVSLNPKVAETHNNLGNVLKDQGKLGEAVVCYRQALALRPDYAEAHSNLGNALTAKKKLDEAVACFRQALALKPDIPEVHNNLGTALKDQGKPDEALACYRRALALKPGYVDALNNVALLLMAQGDAVAALTAIKQSLQIQQSTKAKWIFVDCIKNLRCSDGDSEIQPTLVRALAEPWCRPGKLARVGTDFVKSDPNMGASIARAAKAWPLLLSAPELYGASGLAAFAANELIQALLRSTPVSNVEMEQFLTMARRLLLDAATADEDVDAALNFYSALATQCFINEYIFCCSDDEFQKTNELRESLVAALARGSQVPIVWVVAVAAYFPLSQLPRAARLLELQWPEAVRAILVQQIGEGMEEQQLRLSIPRLTRVTDEVSKLVQDQYEENPYPRWIKTEPAANPRTIAGYLSQQFPLISINDDGIDGSADILIAGCGTGQQSIGMAQIFKGARVLAVDLSLSSLSYARRKTQELGITSIEYAQADLLELGSLDRQFDVVASVGVLHHLADPFAGWRVLLSLLRPGGFMNLGFYSEVARRDLVKTQAFIAEHGYRAVVDDIRRSRQALMERGQRANFAMTLGSPDFYSMSACRDLLFHAREHRMTLPGIDAFLRDNGLMFLGFEIDGAVLRAYRRRFPDDPAATNLAQWHIFEIDNPNTFAGMYQFWIRKVDQIPPGKYAAQ